MEPQQLSPYELSLPLIRQDCIKAKKFVDALIHLGGIVDWRDHYGNRDIEAAYVMMSRFKMHKETTLVVTLECDVKSKSPCHYLESAFVQVKPPAASISDKKKIAERRGRYHDGYDCVVDALVRIAEHTDLRDQFGNRGVICAYVVATRLMMYKEQSLVVTLERDVKANDEPCHYLQSVLKEMETMQPVGSFDECK